MEEMYCWFLNLIMIMYVRKKYVYVSWWLGGFVQILGDFMQISRGIYYIFIIIIMGLNIALKHQNRSYRGSETKENVEAQKRKQIWGNDRKRTATTKNKHN